MLQKVRKQIPTLGNLILKCIFSWSPVEVPILDVTKAEGCTHVGLGQCPGRICFGLAAMVDTQAMVRVRSMSGP